MKNINPQKNLLFKIILFIVVFLFSEFLIMKPLRNKMSNSNKQRLTDFTVVEEVKNDKKEETINSEKEENLKTVSIENDFIKISFNTKGLVINNAILKKYTKSIENKDPIELLVSNENEEYYINHSWLSLDRDLDVPNKNTIWTFDEKSYNTDKTKLIFNYKNKQNVIFTNIFQLDDKYMLSMEQKIQNNSINDFTVKPIIEINKTDTILKNDAGVHNGGIGVFSNKIDEIKIKKLKNKNIEFANFEWGGFTNRYWLVSLISSNSFNGKVNFLKKDNILKMQYTTKNDISIKQNSNIEHKIKMFLGVKDRKILEEYKKKENLKFFDRSIDYGLFFMLTKPLSLLLNLINKIVKNFGFSIIIFTILIKMLLYPMVKKSTIAMIKFRKIQPKIAELQRVHVGNNLEFQKALLKLYSETKANPMAGIIPLFIQIPIFFSLYKVLNISLEMRQAPFIFFIKDLSIKDPTNIINFFGLLPIKPVLHIGILPLFMVLTMILQKKITEGTQKELNQDIKEVANITKYMPWIFLFIFANFPSGLLIYWTMSNIISIAQQFYIERHYK